MQRGPWQRAALDEGRLSYETFAMSALLQQMRSNTESLKDLQNFNVLEGFQCTIFPIIREMNNLFMGH